MHLCRPPRMEGRSFIFLLFIIIFFLLSRLFINPGWDWLLKGGRQQRKGGRLQVVGQGDIFFGLESKLREEQEGKRKERKEGKKLRAGDLGGLECLCLGSKAAEDTIRSHFWG